uniref:Tetratricopeptide repeat protein n=1 Tax=Panagrolaimus superbus TaxID=310955 RepID=A0A914Y7L3_9BILA
MKRTITHKNALVTRAVATIHKYQNAREKSGPKQEIYYNLGRMFHQIGFSTQAVYWYEKVLEEPDIQIFEEDERTGDAIMKVSHAYSLKPLAALNLAFIIKSYNPQKARLLKRKYCVI